MHTINVLMVEDEQAQHDLYTDAIEDFNDGHTDLQIEIEQVKNAEDAISRLESGSFDALLLDLRLENDSGDGLNVASGNEVLKYVFDGGGPRLIINIISGTPESLESDFKARFSSSPLLMIQPRDKDTAEVLEGLIQAWKTGITRILGRRGRLHSLINKIFFDHVSHGFEFWIDKNVGCEDALLRYTALHLLEYLDLPENRDDDSPLETSYFEAEFYIIPPVDKGHPSTGELVTYEGGLYVVLSPSCDLEPRHIKSGNEALETIYNVESVVLAEVLSIDKDLFNELKIPISSDGKFNNDKWRRFSENVIKNGKQRFHYMPAYLDIRESVIDFKRLIYVPHEKFLSPGAVKSVATITKPFMADVQGRFAAYFARQGQPNGRW